MRSSSKKLEQGIQKYLYLIDISRAFILKK